MSRVEVTRTNIPLEAYDYVASLIVINKKTEMPNNHAAPERT